MKEQIKLKRTLHIGLGGTGVKALLHAKQCYLEAYGEIPPMVAFLAIDTDNAARSASRTAHNGMEVTLASNEIALCGLTGDARDIYTLYKTEYSWMPEKNVKHLSGLRSEGAGQIRSNGRFLIQYNAENILTKIQQAIAHVGQPIDPNSRFTYDYNLDGSQMSTYVNVVASIAGGTGAGTLIDLLVLLANKMHSSNPPTRIRPWIVMPDIFRHNFPHSNSERVYSNAYGVLRELDYLYHMDGIDNKGPLSFRFCEIFHKPSELGDTILMNMNNSVGVRYQNVDDITETLGRCLYIDSNEYSSPIGSAFDNTQHSEGHNIKDKVAHYFSAGSAELIYDNNAVANVIADAIISKICDNLTTADNFDAATQALNWTMDQEVRIQEHNADQLTDDLLTRVPPYVFEIGKDTTENDVNAFINSTINDQVKNQVNITWNKKLMKVIGLLNGELKRILNNGGSGKALAFLNELKNNIRICINEMNDELNMLNNQNSHPKDWNTKLSGLNNSILGFTRFNKDLADTIAQEVVETAANQRDALRHQWAISFYNSLNKTIDDHIIKVSNLNETLKKIGAEEIGRIGKIRNQSLITSNFQIFLHKSDAMQTPDINISEILNLMQSKINISDFIGKDKSEISKDLWNFAKKLNGPMTARNVSIEAKLRAMSKEELSELVKQLKNMSSPMWSTNTQGYDSTNRNLVTTFVIGTNEGNNSILNNDDYIQFLTVDSNKPSFVRTHLNDRVSLIQVQSSNPVFAVSNMAEYKKEAELIDKDPNRSAYYIDNAWNERMNKERFDVYPKNNGEDVLPAWVNGIILGYIKYDNDRNEYYMESEQGDLLDGGYLPLGKRRDLAFDAFRNKELFNEVETNISKEIDKSGRESVMQRVREVKNDWKNYVSIHASLSPVEHAAIKSKDDSYIMVRNQLEKELEFLKNEDN